MVFAVAGLHAVSAGEIDSSDTPRHVAATVGDATIYVDEVQRVVDRALAGRSLPENGRAVLEAQALEELVARRLVVAYARRTGRLISAEETERAVSHALREAAGADESPTADSQLCRQVAWRLQWRKLLEEYATEEKMQAYFREHRRELDGTQLTVSHVLIRPDSDGPQAAGTLLDDANALRGKLASGELSFEEAVQNHSEGPSAERKGKLGRIARHGPMVEAFSAAAFQLEPGEISDPVVTPFGIHLIRCDAVHPGNKTLDDVRERVLEGLSRELLVELAAAERARTTVVYTGATPHFDLETGELVKSDSARP